MKAVFFSDFDGTITKKDVIESIMYHFAPPRWKNIHSSLVKGKLDIDVGIRMMFSLIPYPILQNYLEWIYKIHCNRFICNKGRIDVSFNYRCNGECRRNCGVCKPYVIQKYYKNYSLKLYAGDGNHRP
ncbi:MAG: hypothetical protein Q9M89_01690 [Persephonella sp.]|nr:hypothetical protein [Persephonella sp.]